MCSFVYYFLFTKIVPNGPRVQLEACTTLRARSMLLSSKSYSLGSISYSTCLYRVPTRYAPKEGFGRNADRCTNIHIYM